MIQMLRNGVFSMIFFMKQGTHQDVEMRLPASYTANDARVAVLRARGLPLFKPICSAVWEMPRDSPIRCHS